VIGAQFFDQGEYADNQGAAADMTMPTMKIVAMLSGTSASSEDEAVGQLPIFPEWRAASLRRPRFFPRSRDGDELIAVFTQLSDNFLRQGNDGVGALAAAVWRG